VQGPHNARREVKRWIEKLLWVRVGIEIGGMTYTIAVHRLGLRKPRLTVTCRMPGQKLAVAPKKKVWRLN